MNWKLWEYGLVITCFLLVTFDSAVKRLIPNDISPLKQTNLNHLIITTK